MGGVNSPNWMKKYAKAAINPPSRTPSVTSLSCSPGRRAGDEGSARGQNKESPILGGLRGRTEHEAGPPLAPALVGEPAVFCGNSTESWRQYGARRGVADEFKQAHRIASEMKIQAAYARQSWNVRELSSLRTVPPAQACPCFVRTPAAFSALAIAYHDRPRARRWSMRRS